MPPLSVPYTSVQCVPNSEALSVTDLHFAKSHLLLADNAPGGLPILATRDVVFTHIAVEAKTEQNLIIAVDGRTGEMWKLSHWKEGSEWKWSLLENRKLAVGGQVSSLALLPGGMPLPVLPIPISSEFFFTTSPSGVAQFAISSCPLYQSCSLCVVDPYCSWNTAREGCQPREKVHSQSVGSVFFPHL